MWSNRRLLLPLLAVAILLPFAVLTVVTGVVASVPMAPDELLAKYVDAAKNSPAGELQYEQLVALDAVRFRQDFSRVTPDTIRETADFFAHCETKENPETGQEEVVCTKRSLNAVMDDLHLAAEDREYVRNLVEFMQVGDSEGDGGSFGFNPAGPYTWPVDGHTITSPYGPRRDPVTGEWSFHSGVDIAASMYAPVVAAATGTVTWADWDGNYGNTVRIDNGGFQTVYGHLAVATISEGEVVTAGQIIGLAGNTGKSTGPHLHFEWWTDGVPVNPLRYYGGN